jgi:superfamily I DNA/RNA helicase
LLGISDTLEVHSFHALALKYYGVHTDEGIDRVLREDLPPIKHLAFDCIVLDEAQDIRPLLHQLVCKLMRDNTRGKAAQMILLGDERQAIYQFLGADPRFLSASDRVFEGIAPAGLWRSHTLNTTFRHSGKAQTTGHHVAAVFRASLAGSR